MNAILTKQVDCYSKKAGKPPHPDSTCKPANAIQAATTGVKTTKDMNQESNLFKELVAGTKVLTIGVVKAVPGAFPVAHAPALRDAESQPCHPKSCDQPSSRKVLMGTESATLVKPDEPVELKGHRDPDPEQLMLPDWVDVKDAFMHSGAYTVSGQQDLEARYSTVRPSRKGPSMAKWYATCYPITGFDVNMTPMECMDYAESNTKTEISPLTTNGEGESDDDGHGDHPIYTVKPWSRIKATEAVALSLCDGAECAALSLKKVAWEDIEIDHIIAVEKSKTQRKIRDAVNPATDTFPGVEHGLNGSHDITLITEEDIRTMPRGTLKLFLAGPECVDVCKLRLLPDRASYKGPKTPPGQDPRHGLDGKYGMAFRVTIKIWDRVQKYHPKCKFFIENVVFDDMEEDWAEVCHVCDALGNLKPIIVCNQKITGEETNIMRMLLGLTADKATYQAPAEEWAARQKETKSQESMTT